LWAALQAKEADPERRIILLEATRIAEGASGRNGGFADPSLTHGLTNGIAHFPTEIRALERFGLENYAAFLASIKRHGIDAQLEETGTLSVATAEYQIEELREYAQLLESHGDDPIWMDAGAIRSEVDSPTYVAGMMSRAGAIVDPARLAWGLAATLRGMGVRIYEESPSVDVALDGAGIEIRCASGRLRARKALLATNAFRSPVRSMRRATVPIWDYVLMTEPLSEAQLRSLGWRNRQGIGDMGNRFHYYRLTSDNRILWGGYDAIYHFGNRIDSAYEQRRGSFEGLSRRFFQTFPQLEGLRFSHSWGGPIATTTRFCMDVGRAYRNRVAWATGYTGLGVVASRFGGQVALHLLDDPQAPELALRMFRKRPFPWPPEPLRSAVIGLTQRELARADRNHGRRGLWLRLLDGLGLGFDS
jgi:glycine/D-amino acid oxidase-like deaminating enzyme